MGYMYLFLLSCIIILAILPSIWRKFIEGKVRVSAEFAVNTANIGDVVPVEIKIVNNSWLPCPMIHGVLKLSSGLSSELGDSEFLSFTLFMWMKQEVRIRRAVYGRGRGPKQIVSATLEMNEGLGLQPLTVTETIHAPLFILPELLNLKRFHFSTREIIGNVEVDSWLLFDESRYKGVRPYQSRDPMKYIDWRATARTRGIMSKQFSSSTESKIFFVLNVQFVEPYWAGASPEIFDELCSLVATSAVMLEQRGMQLALFANGTMVRYPKKQWYGTQSAKGIRKILSMMLPYVNSPFERLLETVRIETGPEDTLMIATRFLTTKQKWMLQEFQKNGKQVISVAGGQLGGERQ